ncbi:MAG: hypothetical protein ICV85_08695, partial [Tolypothrix sp. T3-bin4]|nr:hypothetical protein [Tolypothrix sp. T3-bin4]
QGKPVFVAVKAKFLPNRNVFGFDSLLGMPQEDAPKFFKASKKMKALALQESKSFKAAKNSEKIEKVESAETPLPKPKKAEKAEKAEKVESPESSKQPLPMPKPKCKN